jgi:hypothetical protein
MWNSTNPNRQATRTEVGWRTFTKAKDLGQPIFTTSTTELDVSVSAQLAVKAIESPVLQIENPKRELLRIPPAAAVEA